MAATRRCASRSSAPDRPAATPPGTCCATRATELHVDIYERLPTPWGLVRAGVAPDHPKIKSVTQPLRAHRRAPAAAPVRQRRVRPPPHRRGPASATTTRSSTRSAHRPTARWVSPARTSPGSYSATDFVGWYNGHPDFCDLRFDLSGERVVVIGAGNVALDVARMLVLTREELAVTDVADHALEALGRKRRARGRRRRAARTRAGGVHQPRAARARRAEPTPT